ncbi:hypothetical protein V6U90_03015 [Micromonospora sp. CPCC 206060]
MDAVTALRSGDLLHITRAKDDAVARRSIFVQRAGLRVGCAG